MPYTRPWDDTRPDGSTTDAADIDTEFQVLREDIHERMDDIVSDWLADPVVLSAVASGNNKAYDYSVSNPPGSKVTASQLVKSYLTIRVAGVTDGVGIIDVDFDELPGGWLVTDIVGAGLLTTMPHWVMGVRVTDLAIIFGHLASFEQTTNTLKIRLVFGDNAHVVSSNVAFYLLLPMLVAK